MDRLIMLLWDVMKQIEEIDYKNLVIMEVDKLTEKEMIENVWILAHSKFDPEVEEVLPLRY